MPARIKLTQEQLDEMLRLRKEEKLSLSEIGKTFGVSLQTVQRRFVEMGIKKEEISLEYKYDKFFFHKIDCPEKAYWLGFITADGYVNEENNFICINLQWGDREHLVKFQKALQAEMVPFKKYHNVTKKPLASFVINGKQIVSDLKKLNVRQGKSTKEIPPSEVPDHLLADYIRGLIDGDGHIQNRGINLRSSYKMCEWVQKVLHDKCNASITKILYESNTYRVYFLKNRYQIFDYLYYSGLDKNLVLDRKYKQVKVFKLRHLKKKNTLPSRDKLTKVSG